MTQVYNSDFIFLNMNTNTKCETEEQLIQQLKCTYNNLRLFSSIEVNKVIICGGTNYSKEDAIKLSKKFNGD